MDSTPNNTGKRIDLSKLQDKFPAEALEWRIGRAGSTEWISTRGAGRYGV